MFKRARSELEVSRREKFEAMRCAKAAFKENDASVNNFHEALEGLSQATKNALFETAHYIRGTRND
jgi:hypothetical protein